MVDRKVTVTATLNDQASSGLLALGRNVGKVIGVINGATAAITPFFAKLSAVAIAIGAATSAKGAQLAERQAIAEERAAAAVKGRAVSFEELTKRANELQAITRISDDSFLEIQASLLQAGVAAIDLERATLAVANTAEATGKSYLLVARSIGNFATGSAGLLGAVIPELKELAAGGRLAADGIDTLNEKYEGVAESIAATDFGQAAASANSYTDTLEGLGETFVRLKTLATDVLNAFTKPFVEFINSDVGRQVFGVLELGLEILKKYARPIAIVVASLTALSLGITLVGGAISLLAPIVGAAIAIVSFIGSSIAAVAVALGPVGLAVVAVGVIILHFTGLLGDFFDQFTNSESILRSFVSDIGSAFAKVFDILAQVGDGTLRIGDAFDILRDRVKISAEFIVDAFSLAFRVMVQLAKDSAKAAGTAIVQGLISGVTLAASIAAGIASNLKLDRVLKFLPSAEELLGAQQVLIAISVNAAKKIGDSFAQIGITAGRGFSALAVTASQAVEDLEENLGRVKIAVEDLARERALEAIRTRGEEAAERIRALASDVLDLNAAIRRTEEIASVSFDDLLDLDDEEFFRQVGILGERSGAKFASAVANSAKVAFAAGQIGFEDLFETQARSTVGVIDQQIEQLEQRLSVQREIADQARAERELLEEAAALDASAAFRQEFILDKTTATVEQLEEVARLRAIANESALSVQKIVEKENIAYDAQSGLLEDLTDAQIRRVQAEAKLGELLARSTSGADTQIQQIEKRLDASLDRIANLATTGQLTRAEIESQVANAVSEATEEVQALEEQLRSLRSLGIDIPGLGSLLERLSTLKTRLLSAEVSTRSFGKGVQDALRSLQREVDNVGALGENLARTGLNGFTDHLITAFAEGSRAAKAFGREALLQMAQMIQRAFILRSTLALLNFLGSGLGGSIGAAAQAHGGPAGRGPKRSYPAELFHHAIHFAGGGRVPGPSIRRDIVPAMLMPEEEVMDVPTVGYYGGPKIWEALRRRLIPQDIFSGVGLKGLSSPAKNVKRNFAGGGAVASQGSAFGGGGGTAQIFGFVDDDLADRIFSQSQGSPFLRYAQGNRGRIRSIISTDRDKRR